MRNRLGCFWSSPVRTPDVIPFDENYTYFYMNMTHWHPKIYAEKKLNANLLTIILGTIRVLRPPPPATKTPESLRRQLETIDFTLAEFATENAALKSRGNPIPMARVLFSKSKICKAMSARNKSSRYKQRDQALPH